VKDLIPKNNTQEFPRCWTKPLTQQKKPWPLKL
jgi:hypothetical protein